MAEIEKQASAARLHSSDESNIRESLVAIRALCDVALEERSSRPQPVYACRTAATWRAGSAREDDANGDSLFDF